jgi:hypothetical protein
VPLREGTYAFQARIHGATSSRLSRLSAQALFESTTFSAFSLAALPNTS